LVVVGFRRRRFGRVCARSQPQPDCSVGSLSGRRGGRLDGRSVQRL
jgi:hypothetical protein